MPLMLPKDPIIPTPLISPPADTFANGGLRGNAMDLKTVEGVGVPEISTMTVDNIQVAVIIQIACPGCRGEIAALIHRSDL